MHLNEIEQLTKAHEKQVTDLENQISKLQVRTVHFNVYTGHIDVCNVMVFTYVQCAYIFNTSSTTCVVFAVHLYTFSCCSGVVSRRTVNSSSCKKTAV